MKKKEKNTRRAQINNSLEHFKNLNKYFKQ